MSPGPNVAVWSSNEPLVIRNWRAWPAGTVTLAGTIPKNSTPCLPATPTSTMPAGATVCGRRLAIFVSRLYWFATFLLCALAVGIFLDFLSTVTVPFMPGWMLQKYVYLPALVKVTVTGLGLGASGSPVSSRLEPLYLTFLP